MTFSIAAFSSIAAFGLTFGIVNFCRFLINTSRRNSRRGAAIRALLYGPVLMNPGPLSLLDRDLFVYFILVTVL